MKEKNNNTSTTVYNNTNKIISIMLLLIITFMQVITIPINANAFTVGVDGIKLTSPSTSLSVGDKVEVIVSTRGQAVSAIDTAIVYDTDIFEIIKEEDIVKLSSENWTIALEEQPDADGKHWLGILTQSGKYLTGDLFKIVFTVKKETTTIKFTEAQVAFADKTTAGDPDIETAIEESVTIEVKEETTHKVTFKNDDGTVIEIIDVPHGNGAQFGGQIPTSTKVQPGYEAIFKGWKDVDKLQNVTEDTTVSAEYDMKPIVYTITYENLRDSDNSQNPKTYTVEDQNINLVNLANKEKYKFKGWYTTNDNTGVKVTSIDTSKLGNIKLYAQWEEIADKDKLYLKSAKYKIGENDIDIYEDGDVYLDKIEPKTTFAQFRSNCETNGIMTVIDHNGNVLGENDLVGTNMTIKVTKDDEEIIITAVVMGDIDGNGKVTISDWSEMNKVVLKERTLKGAQFKAADLDDNEKITVSDSSTENQVILKVTELKYDKKKLNN